MTDSPTPDIEKDIENQLWRLRNFYSCREEGSGKPIPFTPRAEQEAIFQHLIDRPTEPAYIIKSRRLGLSTGLNIFQVDSAAWNSGWSGTLIDLKQEDASKKMTDQIRFAFDNMEPEARARLRIVKKNDSELRFKLQDEEDAMASVIYAAINARGGDSSMLHVSEMGPMAAKDDNRAKEIVNGAFPAASKGRTVVETTWMGGKSGRLWDLIEPIMQKDPNAIGKIFFFPWHDDPEAIQTEGMVTEEVEEYFKTLSDKLSKSFSDEQKKWFWTKKLKHRHETNREYPSTLEEALSSPVEGAIYAPYLDELHTGGFITDYPIDRSALVHTAWDLGAPFNTVTWYFQIIGREIFIIDVDLELNITLTERVSRILSKGYPLGTHLLPHDAANTLTSGKSTQQDLIEAGLANTKIVPRTQNVWIGINATEEAFPRFRFHAKNTEKGRERLQNYRAEYESSSGVAKEVPIHDRNSHAADGLRMMMEGIEVGLVQDSTAKIAGVRKRRATRAKAGFKGGY